MDENFNIIEDLLVIYCKFVDDYLLFFEVCLIIGIILQKVLEDGFLEVEFISQINEVFSQSGICVVGYNSLCFDDEVIWYILYCNLWDFYVWEWQNGNFWWDIIDMVWLIYVLCLEGIIWFKKEDGSFSFCLEELMVVNGIVYESVYDVMFDVQVIIVVVKLIKDKQFKLFDFVL